MLMLKVLLLIFFMSITSTCGFYRGGSNITILTSENFAQSVNSDRIWVVQFYSYKSRDCQNFEQEFLIAANVLKNIVKFGAVNVENSTELAKNFNVDTKSLPLIKIFGIADDDEAITYDGSKTAKDLVDSILTNILEKIKSQFGEILPENLVTEVNDKNFDQIVTNSPDMWLVQFYAPWCVHCKEFKPIWEQVAVYLKGRVRLASIDATVNKIKAKQFEIKAYPTVKLLPPDQKSPKYALNYAQERSVTEIVNWVQEMLPPPEVVQIIDQDAFRRNCLLKKLCVVTFLPHILDCETICRGNYLAILNRLGETYKRHDWGWMWSEGGAQQAMETLLDIGGFGYPTLVVLNPAKRKYTVFKGACAKHNINEFLVQLAKANAASIEEDIAEKIVDVEEWDGDDLSANLSDVIKDEL